MYQDKLNWLERVTSKTIALVFHVLCEDRFNRYIYKLVRLGESKLTPSDKKQIEYLRNNLDSLDLS